MNFNDFQKKISKEYKHIDYSLQNNEAKRFFEKVKDPEYVKKHRFLPFIQYDIEFKKYSKSISKQKIKIREISLVSHHDTGIYAYYSELLNDAYNNYAYEHGFSENAVAYRNDDYFKGSSNIDVAKETFDFIDFNKKNWIIKGDFKGFFDNLDHSILNKNVERVLKINTDDNIEWDAWKRVLNSLEKYQLISRKKLVNAINFSEYHEGKYAYFKNLKNYGEFIKQRKRLLQKSSKFGIPQGTSLSAVLANVYMIDFDSNVDALLEEYNGIYRRYSDDFIIVIPFEEMNEESFNLFGKEMHHIADNNKLLIEVDKTKRLIACDGNFYKIEDGAKAKTNLDYLGFSFSDNTVSIRPKSVYKFLYSGKKYLSLANRSKVLYKLVKKHPDYTANDIYNTYYSNNRNNYFKKPKILKAIQKAQKRAKENKGFPEISLSYLRTLSKLDREKIMPSYVSYAKLANRKFNEGQIGYKVNIISQTRKQQKRLDEFRKTNENERFSKNHLN